MSSSNSPQSLPSQHPEAYIGYELFAVAIVFIVVDVTCVALRICARYLSKARAGLDDYFVIPSLIFCIAVCAICISEFIISFSIIPSVQKALAHAQIAWVEIGGIGHHAAAFKSNPSVLARYAKLEVAFIYLYLVAVTLPKIVILSLYLRIFPTEPYRSACYVIAGVLVASLMANLTVVSVICIPLKETWNPNIQGAHCINQDAFFRYSTLPNIITDLCMFVLPLPIIWRMSLSTRDKIGLTLTFCAGSM